MITWYYVPYPHVVLRVVNGHSTHASDLTSLQWFKYEYELSNNSLTGIRQIPDSCVLLQGLQLD